MTIGIGVWALVIYIGVILTVSIVFKKDVGIAMLISFISVSIFGVLVTNLSFFDFIKLGIKAATTETTAYAVMLFVFVSIMMGQTGIIHRLIDILNSLVGRVRGGSAYVSLIASVLFGSISGSPGSNATTVGSITIPWMIEDGWKKETAATMVCGNSGGGITTPPSNTMFVLLAVPMIADAVSFADLYKALWIGGGWTTLFRLLLVAYFVRKYNIQRRDNNQIVSLKQSFKRSWTSLFIFLGVIIPMLLTTGSFSDKLKAMETIGPAIKKLQLVLLIPVILLVVLFVEGFKYLPKDKNTWNDIIKTSIKRYGSVAGPIFFAYCACAVLENLNLAADMSAFLSSLHLSRFLAVLIVVLIIVLVAGPLTSTATVTATGAVSYAMLTAAGASPLAACITIIVACSTEGSTPPASIPCYISSGIAGCEAEKTFVPLLIYYCLPILIIAILIGMGILPVIF